MEYVDEIILKKREEKKKEKYATLEDGIYLDGKVMNFRRKDLLGEFSILLPDVLRQMPEIYAKIKYPSEFRPQRIFTTLDMSVNFGFSVFPREISCEDLMALTERMIAAIHRANSDCRLYPKEELEKVQGWYFAFRSHAIDIDVYNMMLAATVQGKLIQASFNCHYKEYRKWKKTVRMMWDSIVPIEEE